LEKRDGTDTRESDSPHPHHGPAVTAEHSADDATDYLNVGFQRLLDIEGLPASKPPWGTLTAMDLKQASILWLIPLGVYPEVLAQGLSGLGAENYGGPVVTAGGGKLGQASGSSYVAFALPMTGFTRIEFGAYHGESPEIADRRCRISFAVALCLAIRNWSASSGQTR
jgi:hypothetical protein